MSKSVELFGNDTARSQIREIKGVDVRQRFREVAVVQIVKHWHGMYRMPSAIPMTIFPWFRKEQIWGLDAEIRN